MKNMKILVLAEDSDESRNAIKKSIEIAKIGESSIKLVSIVSKKQEATCKRYAKRWHQVDGSFMSDKEIPEINLAEDAGLVLDEIIRKTDFSGIKVEKQVLYGESYAVLFKQAVCDQADLIIIGNKGTGRIRQFFMNLQTADFISKTACPVLMF